MGCIFTHTPLPTSLQQRLAPGSLFMTVYLNVIKETMRHCHLLHNLILIHLF
jgi:hypothetical protein